MKWKTAKGKIRTIPRGMNNTELEYANFLDLLKLSGEIFDYAYEPEKLRLGNNCHYTPDFRVQRNDGTIEFYEVKGFWRDDARVKIKAAAELHPYRFVAVTKNKGQWVEEDISAKVHGGLTVG